VRSLLGGLNAVLGSCQRGKDFPLTEGVEGLIGEAFESNAEQNESDVAIFGAGS